MNTLSGYIEMEKKLSWVPTLVAQLSLCICLYLAFQIGQQPHNKSSSESSDLYFISVRGGFRPLKQQTHLLKQMEKVAKKYKAKFVMDITEHGEDDPLMQNGTLHFSSLKVPWYTSIVSGRYGGDYFQKQIRLPYERTLDILCVDTGLIEEKVLISESSRESGLTQANWLARILEATSSNWLIVVGLHPLVKCGDTEEKMEEKQVFEYLHNSFMKYKVDAYISGQGCNSNVQHGRLSYIGNPGSMNALAPVNETSSLRRESEIEFLLHRVSSLEMVTYFVSSGGVVRKSVIHQKSRAFT